ncbi:hypothetical protein B4Q04_14485 [Zobellia sp. OII3]|uniref:hypothetical protein n=1 Tax=Zobellia sp. OII3 TaxID=2034520 RepID=UPI000B5358B9|nr:hypothetical protein [Zobellia sp. OII3]OWW24521.1 hypothetical protein B4Q04_14485 [Zobellia sp. OII3]
MKASITQNNFKIITSYQNQVVANNKLHLDFDKIETAIIQLEIVASDNNDPSFFEDVEWVIIENNIRVDEHDYTGGQKAELTLSKEQAGPHDAPSFIKIEVLHPEIKITETVEISLAATPTITEVSWFDPRSYENISETVFNTFVGISITGEGITGIPLTVELCLRYNNEIIDGFKATKDINNYYTELKKEWHARKFLFFNEIRKVYLLISYVGRNGKQVIYNGKKENNFLTIDGVKFFKEAQTVSNELTTVTVGEELYFTQRYEPCKYKTISYTFADQDKVTIFDEDNQPTNTPYRQPNISIMVGAHKKPLVIEVSGHDENTKCSAVERGEEAHSKRIVNKEEVPEEHIISYEGSKLSFTPYFPYKYLDENQKIQKWNYLKFLGDYFIPPKADEIIIPVETCRYSKNIRVKIAPDVSWAAHFQIMLSPSQLEEKPEELQIASKKDMYFRGIDNIKLHRGIDELIEKYRPQIEDIGSHFMVPMTIVPNIGIFKSLNEFVVSLMLDYIKSIGSCMAVGFHTYYNEEDGGCREIVSYTERYPHIANMIFGLIIIIFIVVDILVLILSGGSSAAARIGIKASAKTAKMARKIQKIQDIYDKVGRKTEHNIFQIDMPILTRSIGYGYKVFPDGTSGYNFELKLSANPIFGLTAEINGHAGDYLLDVTGISTLFSITRFGVGWWGKILKFKKFKKNIPLSKRVYKMKRKKGKNVVSSGWSGAMSLNKSGARKLITPGDVIIILNDMEENLAEKARKYAEELGQTLEYYISIEGKYSAQFKVDFNIPDDGAPIIEMKNTLANGEEISTNSDNEKKSVSFSRKKSIEVYAFVKASSKFTFTTNWIAPYMPEWLGTEIKQAAVETRIGVDGKAEAMLQGGIAFERKYALDNEGRPYSQDLLLFSGIAGNYEYNVKFDRKDEDNFPSHKSEKEDKLDVELKGGNPDLIILEPFSFPTEKTYLFELENIVKGI